MEHTGRSRLEALEFRCSILPPLCLAHSAGVLRALLGPEENNTVLAMGILRKVSRAKKRLYIEGVRFRSLG